MSIQIVGNGFELRPWQIGDVSSLVEHANDPDVALQLRDRFPSPYTRTDADQWIPAANQEPVSQCAIVIEGRAVGGIGIDFQSDIYRRGAELGYWLGKAFWRKGLMSRIVLQFVPECFRRFDLNRIEAGVFSTNTASMRILEKAGFTREGIRRQAIFKKDQIIDEHVYSILVNEVRHT